MRVFSVDEEERAFRHQRLRDWRSAGLIAADKAPEAEALAGEPPAHAAWPLRILLFGFAALALGALSALVLKDLKGRMDSAVTAWFLAAAAVAAAEAIIGRLKVRRFGAEEALVTGAVVLAAYGTERAFSTGTRWHFSMGIFSAALALGASAAYLRYGYRLASFGAAAALGMLVGSLEYGEHATRVLLAVLYGVLLALATWWPGLDRRERDRLEIVRFFLAMSVPLCLNLRLEKIFYSWAPQPVSSGAFGLATFAAILLIPLVWLAWGALDRSRTILWAGALGLLIAQCSVKPYLGLKRNAWDPAVLGLELMIVALVLKRWLDAGPGGRRGACSSEALGDPGPGAAAGLLASAVAASHSSPPSGPDRPKGGGGSFGGGGASGSF